MRMNQNGSRPSVVQTGIEPPKSTRLRMGDTSWLDIPLHTVLALMMPGSSRPIPMARHVIIVVMVIAMRMNQNGSRPSAVQIGKIMMSPTQSRRQVMGDTSWLEKPLHTVLALMMPGSSRQMRKGMSNGIRPSAVQIGMSPTQSRRQAMGDTSWLEVLIITVLPIMLSGSSRPMRTGKSNGTRPSAMDVIMKPTQSRRQVMGDTS